MLAIKWEALPLEIKHMSCLKESAFFPGTWLTFMEDFAIIGAKSESAFNRVLAVHSVYWNCIKLLFHWRQNNEWYFITYCLVRDRFLLMSSKIIWIHQKKEASSFIYSPASDEDLIIFWTSGSRLIFATGGGIFPLVQASVIKPELNSCSLLCQLLFIPF